MLIDENNKQFENARNYLKEHEDYIFVHYLIKVILITILI